MHNKKIKISLSIFMILFLLPEVYSSNAELLSRLKIERDIISSAIEAIKMINKSQLISINSMTSESMLTYSDLLKSLDSPDLSKENINKLNILMNSCIDAHKIFINESKSRMKDNLDLIAELKETYPDIFNSSFCIDSTSKYTEAIAAINEFKSGNKDMYEIIQLIIISDRTFSVEMNDFKAIK
jgi:Leucine-rich repeat (LRR) protein